VLATRPTRQFALDVVAPVRDGVRTRLDTVLDRIGSETLHAMQGQPVPHPLIDFDAVPTLHYARWVVLPGRGDSYQSPGGGESPPRGPESLAFSAWFDGPEGEASVDEARERENVLVALVAAGRQAFDALYESCEGYPEAASDGDVVAYLLARQIPPAALYFGSPGRSRRQILEEAELARRVRRIVDDLRTHGPLPAAGEVRRRVIAELGAPPPAFPRQERDWDTLLARALLVPLLAPFALVALPWLLVLEATDKPFAPIYSAAERAHVEITTRGENLFYQNPLSNIVEVKGGAFRRLLIRLVLFAIDTLAREYFVRGTLGEIPSIHAAHWYLLDGGRRLAFTSNYDGSWESYLGDFIDQASSGLTAVWSNTSGYPRTHFLAFAGSNAGDRFKAWSHHIQVCTRVWYAAYPSLSIVQINDATLIRRGLADPHAVPPEQWLARLT
jgi:hypothetical protein